MHLRRFSRKARNLAGILVSLSMACAGLLGPMPSVAAAASDYEVQQAVDRAKEFLYRAQNGGNWEAVAAPLPNARRGDVRGWQWGGLTSMATYALLAADEKPKSVRLAPSIAWLEKADIRGTYAVALRAQVWTFLPEREAKAASRADFDTLTKLLYTDGPGAGFYPYYIDEHGVRRPPGYFDRSVSQYGVLGMWACEQAGQEVPNRYWQGVDAAWKAAQDPNGGWSYGPVPGATPAMTAAGVATLFITQDHLLGGSHWDTCAGGPHNDNIKRGLAYMDDHVDELLHGNYYGMYGVERIGLASGRKYFGSTDWYAVGADFLARQQNADGSWTSPLGPIPTTVFAMLFLVHGRAPVMMNKLQWEAPIAGNTAKAQSGVVPVDPWNERPHDVANAARWGGGRLEVELNWQIVNLKVSPDALHDAPVLFMAGSQAMAFDDADADKLREFVQGGGMIFGNADCGSAVFARSFADLGHKLFPKYEMRELPPIHPIYTNEQFLAKKWKERPRVLGLSNGARELMVLVPDADLSRVWQVRAEKTREDLYQLGQNIFLYAGDKDNLKNGHRFRPYIARLDRSVTPARKVRLARIMAGDNPDPEPGGWRRMVSVLHNSGSLDLDVQPVGLGDGKLVGPAEPGGFNIAHWTGTTKVILRDAQRQELKAFVHAGGTLIIDAAGGSSDFASAVEKELNTVFGTTPGVGAGGGAGSVGSLLPPDHPVYCANGAKPQPFYYRKFTRDLLSDHPEEMTSPRLRGITDGGRVAVFYSPEDITTGLVGNPVDGILGYEPQTATRLMTALILYAGKQTPALVDGPDQTTPSGSASKPKARTIVFVVSGAASMLDKAPALKTQLKLGLNGLKDVNHFNVVFFRDGKALAFDDSAAPAATPDVVRRANDFVDAMTPAGLGDPVPALEVAFRQKPNLIYLLADSNFPSNKAVRAKVDELNKDHKVKIVTIAFVGKDDTDTDFIKVLQDVAKESGGTYKVWPK